MLEISEGTIAIIQTVGGIIVAGVLFFMIFVIG